VNESADQTATYRIASPAWVRIWVAVYAVAGIGLAIVWAVAPVHGWPDSAVFAVLFVGFGLISWWNLILCAYELRLQDAAIEWRAPLRSGSLPLESVRSIRNVVPAWPWPLVRIGGVGGPSVFVYGKKPLRAFVDRMVAKRAGIKIDAASYASWRSTRWYLHD
jgi:hypothetical protein